MGNICKVDSIEICLLIVKLTVISLRTENAEGLRKGSRDSATVVRPAVQQNDCYPDDVCYVVAALHFLAAL